MKKKQLSIRTLMLCLTLASLVLVLMRARVDPPKLRIHIVSPRSYTLAQDNVKESVLAVEFSSFVEQMHGWFHRAQLEVVLPPRPHDPNLDPDIQLLNQMGHEANFDFVTFTRN